MKNYQAKINSPTNHVAMDLKKYSKWMPYIGGGLGAIYALCTGGDKISGHFVGKYAALGAMIAFVIMELIIYTNRVEENVASENEPTNDITEAENDSVTEENSQEKLELTQNSLPGEIDYIEIPDTIQKTLPKNEEGLKDLISDYKKYIEEEWTESIPMYAAIELDKTGFVFTPEIIKQLDAYAKSLKFKNFVELLTYYIPK